MLDGRARLGGPVGCNARGGSSPLSDTGILNASISPVRFRPMLILGLILFGMLVGAGAQLIVGRSSSGTDWTMALVAGLIGSFVGGLLGSLIFGDGLELRPSGIIGSLIGAVLVTLVWRWWRARGAST